MTVHYGSHTQLMCKFASYDTGEISGHLFTTRPRMPTAHIFKEKLTNRGLTANTVQHSFDMSGGGYDAVVDVDEEVRPSAQASSSTD